jgi:LmbE family N-acetylglucosaminyl deacetylase
MPDGALEYGFGLRRRIAREIRRHRPDVLLVANYDLTYSMGPGNLVVNQADHRAVGIATLDASRDAGNRWIFVDLLDEGFEPWAGVSHVYVMGSNQPTHATDVTRTLPAGIDSLKAHATYIDGLGRDFDPEAFLRRMTSWAGSQLGVADAVAFGRVQINGV